MSDSFFTSRNQVDPQIEYATDLFCDELTQAATRRIIKLHGPLEASKRLQRLADICAGAYVLPIDHWKTLGAPAAEEPKEVKAKTRKARIVELVAAHGHWFIAGMIFNMLLSALPWVFR
ncbi:MAG: hypothetical protein WA975_17905 [Mesorhizobium sp.]